jgi:hypothetical protein
MALELEKALHMRMKHRHDKMKLLYAKAMSMN